MKSIVSKRNVLITGGTKGIGLAVANALAPQSAALILTYSNDEVAAEEARCTLIGTFPQLDVKLVRCDVTEKGAADVLAKRMEKENFVPDLMIMNAGVTNRKSPFEISEEEWMTVFQGNIHFPMQLIRVMVPKMSPGSAIIFTGSMMGVYPHSMSLSYGVTKSAVHSLVQNLVKHLEPYGIRVAGVAPGFVDTEWQKGKAPSIRRNIEAKVALHRFASPEEVGDAFRMIADNDYFNGDIITLSGGYSYQ